MPDVNSYRIPICGKHASGQAVVRLNGRDHYLGTYGSPEAKQAYERLITEWIAQGRQMPRAEGLTVSELILVFWRHAEKHYRRADGTQTEEIGCLRAAFRPLKELYGLTLVKDFGPLALKAVRQRMIETVNPVTGLAWCRRSINLHTYRIRAMFRWGVEQELVPASVYHGLQAVRGLQTGRSEARETAEVKPVPEAFVNAVRPHVSPIIEAMMDLQLLSGMRPGEVVIMRGCDLNMSGNVWTYIPESHKTERFGHQRLICLGPKAQEVLRPFLKPDLQAYLFSPREAEEYRLAKLRQTRKGKGSHQDRKKKTPKVKPGECYSTDSYNRCIGRACRRAGVPVWHVHQLRHNAATKIRKEVGMDAARIALGHRQMGMTQLYAEADQGRAAEVMEKLG